MSKNIAVIGGGGFAKEVIEVAEMLGYSIYGIFAKENSLKDYQYRGYLDELLEQKNSFDGVIIAIGAVNQKGMKNRAKVIEFLEQNNISSLSLISPLALISPTANIGKGVYIAHHVMVSCDAKISDYVLINHQAVIGHDTSIDINVSIAPQVFLGGNVSVKSHTMIGAAATVIQGVIIHERSTIGLRSVILKNIKPDSLVVTTPSKIYR